MIVGDLLSLPGRRGHQAREVCLARTGLTDRPHVTDDGELVGRTTRPAASR